MRKYACKSNLLIYRYFLFYINKFFLYFKMYFNYISTYQKKLFNNYYYNKFLKTICLKDEQKNWFINTQQLSVLFEILLREWNLRINL